MDEEYECCASGYCEICRGAQGLILSITRGGESDE